MTEKWKGTEQAEAASDPSGERLAGRFRGRGPDRFFDPRPMRDSLLPLLRAIEAVPDEIPDPLSAEVMEPLLREHAKPEGGFFSRSQLIAAFSAFSDEADFRFDEARFRRRVQRRPVRTQSGVTPLTVLTKPFPCPGKCIFCPNDVRMPKSYLSDEPGAQRAANNHFDPYLQTWNRLAAFDATGHPTDKIELIVLGGTWSFYPHAYQIYFVARCLEAMNDFGAGRDGRDACRPTTPNFEEIDAEILGEAFRNNPYNKTVTKFLQDKQDGLLVLPDEESDWARLFRAQQANEAAGARCVGLVLETRPDHVDEAEVIRLRRLGATKVQLGVQSLDDRILSMNRRGHDVAATRRAFDVLRRAGFKLHAHWMANLLGATPAGDREDFRRLFEDPSFRPDELKIYPCSLIETAELMGPWKRGEWSPYDDAELLEVVADAMPRVPRWCRVTRVIRDISSDDIVAGNKRTNFRQIAEAEISRRGDPLVEIRHREIRGEAFEAAALELVETEFETECGREIFLELVTTEDRIVGFLRLCLPKNSSFIDELGTNALVRELHVYGGSVQIGAASGGRAQHRGLGARLLQAAQSSAREAGYPKLSVISAIGTRGYYRQQGFIDGELYQHLTV
ncbi:MAG TPA: tRNA uridine(34) 5-carboxymethylaminomethyl modification radical SAM/GNAT enzyme Elp3 [Myxococcales bacterium]|nr:tRNA uridine(34) 5-carboxymethylaminomethyl modification radical SAM/GNAT enzyme Elp3 [Myxococcales bacterium]HIK85361.1 tRNA uridine(34) 5-carboxymethylaminomethyl modification radical SAM/GNAT enzyme Elp3 [Myxococcales bacterium]